jgi:hypothetical protein
MNGSLVKKTNYISQGGIINYFVDSRIKMVESLKTIIFGEKDVMNGSLVKKGLVHRLSDSFNEGLFIPLKKIISLNYNDNKDRDASLINIIAERLRGRKNKDGKPTEGSLAMKSLQNIFDNVGSLLFGKSYYLDEEEAKLGLVRVRGGIIGETFDRLKATARDVGVGLFGNGKDKKGIRNMLFTATMSADIKEIINNYLQPGFKEISINAEEFVNRNIEHQYFIYKQGEKNDALKAFLAQRTDQRGILFCRTKTDAKRIAKQLAGFEVTAGALHGNLNQEMRDKVMRGFKKGRINLLVATDIAARGIDVKELDYIIHYHLPEKAEYYTHRSGRTARAGKSGISVCMIQSKDVGEITKLASELQIQFDEIKVEVEPQSHSKESIVVFVNLGFGQGFTRSNLAEFLVEEAGMNASDVKNVVVEDHHSSFEIPERYEKQLFINLKGFKIAHRNVKLTLS